MRVNQLSSGYADPASLGKRAETLDAVLAQRAQQADAPTAPSAASDALKRTLAGYDVKNITPAEFSEMIQKLAKSGAISDSELKELSAVRVDLEAAGVESNEKVNLVDFFADKVRKARQQSGGDQSELQKQLAPLLRRRDWIDKFALIQANPDSAGLNAVA